MTVFNDKSLSRDAYVKRLLRCLSIQPDRCFLWRGILDRLKGTSEAYVHRGKTCEDTVLLLLLSRFSRVRLCATPYTAAHPHPWDSPGKNTGVGCHFLLQCMKVKSESEVTQSCLTLRDPMDCSPPGSSVHGIFQARILEWGAIAFSRGHSEKVSIWKPKREEGNKPPNTLILDFLTSSTVRKLISVF